MTELSPEASERLKAARDRYQSSLPLKSSALKVLRKSLDNPEFETMMDMRNQAHKIAGSAGLYGFEGLQRTAAALDQALRQTSQDDTNIRGLIDQLINELDRLCQQ